MQAKSLQNLGATTLPVIGAPSLLLWMLSLLAAGSRPSTVMGFGTYSDTDSWFAGLFGDIHWGEGTHQVTGGLMQGTIRNEYDVNRPGNAGGSLV